MELLACAQYIIQFSWIHIVVATFLTSANKHKFYSTFFSPQQDCLWYHLPRCLCVCVMCTFKERSDYNKAFHSTLPVQREAEVVACYMPLFFTNITTSYMQGGTNFIAPLHTSHYPHPRSTSLNDGGRFDTYKTFYVWRGESQVPTEIHDTYRGS